MTIDFPKQSHISGLRTLWKEAFGDTDLFLDHFFRTGFSHSRCRCILDGDQPVAALYWFDCQWQEKKLAYVYAVATAKGHRGQGLCHQLMEDTHRLLSDYHGIVLVPAQPTLFSFYEKMGYRCFGGIRQWKATADDSIPLQEIDHMQYVAQRNQYLPGNSILHDGNLMEFLGTYTRFYQGSNFLICCADNDGSLMGYELLGNPTAASGILAALGFSDGTFRAPGDAPFAMYRSLNSDDRLPGYYAFALD